MNREVLINTQPYSASTINTASSYDYLKQFHEKVSDDPGGKNLTFLCKLHQPGFKKQLRTSTTANLKQHTELKHPASLSRYVRVNKKIKRHGNSEPKQILYHPNCINGVQKWLRCLHLPAAIFAIYWDLLSVPNQPDYLKKVDCLYRSKQPETQHQIDFKCL